MHEPSGLGARRIWICDDAWEHVPAGMRIDAPLESDSHFIADFFTSSSDLP
jgi:hypothetical protein